MDNLVMCSFDLKQKAGLKEQGYSIIKVFVPKRQHPDQRFPLTRHFPTKQPSRYFRIGNFPLPDTCFSFVWHLFSFVVFLPHFVEPFWMTASTNCSLMSITNANSTLHSPDKLMMVYLFNSFERDLCQGKY